MGVDAEMFVRIKGRENWLRPEHELAAAYELASSVGADNFFVQFNDETGALDGHHALSIVRPYGDDEYENDPALKGKVVWEQDGPEIIADADEQFIRVHLWSRYYGPSYARGNWPVIRQVIEWLAMRFPTGEVWYGGDSSGICAEHMTAARVKEFNDFFLETGRKTYTRYPSPFQKSSAPICPCCRTPSVNTGGGQGHEFYYCDGCGQKFIQVRGGDVHLLGRYTDFFPASSNIREGKPARAKRDAA